MQQVDEDGSLPADPQRGDYRPVEGGQRPARKPSFEPAASVRHDDVLFREGVEMVSDRAQREAEPPREFPQVKSRLRRDETANPLTRGQGGAVQGTTSVGTRTRPRRGP